jgi:transcriptional regulator with XRE-family HTH domain
VNTSIGQRLKQAREAHKPPLSQADVARIAGVSQSTIGNIEADIRKKPRELLGIAAALGVSAEWLESGRGAREGKRSNGSEWPLQLITSEQWGSLSERQRGAVEAAALRAVDAVLSGDGLAASLNELSPFAHRLGAMLDRLPAQAREAAFWRCYGILEQMLHQPEGAPHREPTARQAKSR